MSTELFEGVWGARLIRRATSTGRPELILCINGESAAFCNGEVRQLHTVLAGELQRLEREEVEVEANEEED